MASLTRRVHLLLAIEEGLHYLAHEFEVRAFVDNEHSALVQVLRVPKELEHNSDALLRVRWHRDLVEVLTALASLEVSCL